MKKPKMLYVTNGPLTRRSHERVKALATVYDVEVRNQQDHFGLRGLDARALWLDELSEDPSYFGGFRGAHVPSEDVINLIKAKQENKDFDPWSQMSRDDKRLIYFTIALFLVCVLSITLLFLTRG